MSERETQKQETVRREQAQRRRWGAIISGSYALDVVFLLAFAWIGSIPWKVPLIYGAGAAAICLAYDLAIARGWNLASRDRSLTVQFTALGTGLQLFVIALAPQITFPYLANLFTVFAFGMLWLRPRASVALWSAVIAVTGAVFWFAGDRIGVANNTRVELLLSWLYFSLVLARLLALSIQASAIRAHLADSRKRLAESLAQIQELVNFDDLTKAFNRRSLMARLEQERVRAERTGCEFTVAIFDIDHFKNVNDAYGHLVGDEALVCLVETVARTIREIDIFGRLGGEEFLLILVDTDPQAATEVLERVRVAVECGCRLPMVPALAFTVSTGAAGFRKGESSTVLLNRADKALYRAKNAGRNQTVVA
jgi:diguanylate cyclase